MAEAVLRRQTAGVPLERLGEISYDRAGVAAFTMLFAGTALGAYALGPVPVQWLAQLLAIGAAGFLVLGRRLPPVPGLGPWVWLVGWAAVLTLGNLVLRDFAALMPPLATSAYPVFLALRFMTLLAFASAAALTYWIVRRGHQETVVRRIVWIGSAAAAAAIYIYFAQLNGWWEPGRTRVGTAGGEQSTAFAYAFHRAMGTFREPSHLAEWLVLPFLLAFTYRGRAKGLHIAVLSVALLLTGSLTGILGVVCGMAGAMVLGNPFRAGRLKMLLRLAIVGGLGLSAFGILAASRTGATPKGLVEVFRDRIAPILEGGMVKSNRYYVYEYVAEQPPPLVGYGLGNGNLVFSEATDSAVTSSFLSIYLNTWYSLGVVGMVILALLLGGPVLRLAARRRFRTDPTLMPLMAAYLGWLVMYAVHSDELTIPFGILFGLMAWEGSRATDAPPAPDRAGAPDATRA